MRAMHIIRNKTTASLSMGAMDSSINKVITIPACMRVVGVCGVERVSCFECVVCC